MSATNGRAELNAYVERLRTGPPIYSQAEIKSMQQVDVDINARIKEKANLAARALIINYGLKALRAERILLESHLNTVYSYQVLRGRSRDAKARARLELIIDSACSNLRSLMIITRERDKSDLQTTITAQRTRVQQNSLFD